MKEKKMDEVFIKENQVPAIDLDCCRLSGMVQVFQELGDVTSNITFEEHYRHLEKEIELDEQYTESIREKQAMAAVIRLSYSYRKNAKEKYLYLGRLDALRWAVGIVVNAMKNGRSFSDVLQDYNDLYITYREMHKRFEDVRMARYKED